MGLKLFDRKFGAALGDGPPASPGIYVFRDEAGRALYVGKAKQLRRRLASYRNATRRKVHRKMRLLVRKASTLEVEPLSTERAALLRENELIRALRPPFNVDGAFSFLYPAIGIGRLEAQHLFCFTTSPGSWGALDLRWFGVFRSRPRAKDAFDALMSLLGFLAHREPSSRRPAHPSVRGSRLVAFRQVDPEVSAQLETFLAGRTAEPLGRLAQALLEKPGARREAERVEEDLRCLAAFYEADLRRLREALDAAGLPGTFIAQDERDALFIATREPGTGEEEAPEDPRGG